jgi:RNA polymerase sigma-70 factor (ECF subfamily)
MLSAQHVALSQRHRARIRAVQHDASGSELSSGRARQRWLGSEGPGDVNDEQKRMVGILMRLFPDPATGFFAPLVEIHQTPIPCMATLLLWQPQPSAFWAALWRSVASSSPSRSVGNDDNLAPNDAELMERIAGGDPGAYRELVERHLRGVHAFVYRMLGNRAEAEEVCQESFLRLWKQASTYVPRAKPTTWLYRIAHNLAIDQLRRRRRDVGEGIDELPASGRPSLHLHDKQVAEAVQRALDELPERQRAAIGLVHYQGMSNAEAAEVLGVKLRALESLLARGRRLLRERLSEFQAAERSTE